MRKQKILELIKLLQQQKEELHIVPAHVLTSEIINMGYAKPYKELNELVKEGKLRFCKTLNNVAFTIKK